MAPAASPHQDLLPNLVPIDELGLLVGDGGQMLLLNRAAVAMIEAGDFEPPAGFLAPTTGDDPSPEAAIDFPCAGEISSEAFVIDIHGRCVTVSAPADDSAGSLFRHWLPWRRAATPDDPAPSIRIQQVDESLAVIHSGRPPRVCRDSLEALSAVNESMATELHGRSDWLAVFHAASAVLDNKLVVLIGASCAGKSTLLATLCATGAQLFSEDCLPLMGNPLRAAAMPACIKLRPESWAPLEPLIPGLADFPVERRREFPVKYWAARATEVPIAPVTVLLFPRYGPESPPVLERMSLAETMLGIIESQSGPAMRTADGWRALAGALRGIPAYSLEYSSVAESRRLIDELLGTLG